MEFIISTIVCIAVLIIINFSGGRGEKQFPAKFIIQLFLLGFASAIIIAVYGALINGGDDVFVTGLLGVSETNIFFLLIKNFLMIALVEEGFKFLSLKLFLKKHDCIKCEHHAVIAIAAIASGFSATENIVFLLGDAELWIRIIFGTSGHLVYAVFMGYYIAKSMETEDPAEKKKFKRNSILIPIFMHGTYDFSCSILQFDIETFLYLFILLVLLIIFIKFYLIEAIKKIKETSRADIWTSTSETDTSVDAV